MIFHSLNANEMKLQQFSPIEWQIVNLQENIEKKIIRSLSPIIAEDEFIIEVKIGIDKDSQDSPTSKNVTTTKQAKKVQFNNSLAPTNSEDYVIFNKLGIEAPIVGEEPVEIKTSEAELNQKAFIEMNDRFNLFKFLKSISINLTFDKGLPQQTKDIVKKIIQGLTFNIEGVVPQINIQFLELQSSKVAKIEKAKNDSLQSSLKGDLKQIPFHKSLLEKMENIDLAAGIIFGSLILAAALFYMARQSGKSQNAESSAGGASGAEAGSPNQKGSKSASSGNSPEDSGSANPSGGSSLAQQLLGDETNNDEESEDDMKIDLTKTDPLTNRINDGLGRFKKLYTNHQSQAILLIKGWIKASKANDQLALRSLVQTLIDTELAEIFNLLTIEERSSWKMTLQDELSKEDVAKGFTYIGQKVMEIMMVPSFIDDYEVCDLLLDISAEDAARFSTEKKELGVIFVNVLSSNIISEMFKLLPDENVIELIDSVQTYTKNQILEKLPLLKEKLIEIKVKREKPPFIMRIFELLPNAKAEIEPKLYATLLKNFSLDEIKNASIKVLPSSILTLIPDSIYKQIVTLMPIDLQVQYFASMDSEEREQNLNKFATKGTKNREMIDLELNPILKNEVQLKRMQTDKREKLQTEYLNYARQFVASSSDAQKEIVPIIENWLIDLRDEDIQTHKAA